MQLLVLVFDIVAFRRTGLVVAWDEFVSLVIVALFAAAMWTYYVAVPDRNPAEWTFAEAFLILALILALGVVGGPAQYGAVALKEPLIDRWLASADAALGVNVPSLVSWTRAHPRVIYPLFLAYDTIVVQTFLPVLVLGMWFRERDALWEWAFHFHLCAVVTLACSALWPSEGPFTFYGFSSVLDQTRIIAHLQGFRDGTMVEVHPRTIEGLITFPSFHAAVGLITTWAFRRRRFWLVGLVPLNAALIAATMLLGVHYAIDIVASVALCGVSVVLFRALKLAPAIRQARPSS